MLSDNATQQPSMFQRFCLCQCGPEARTLSGIEKNPKLRGLAGVTLQDGAHETAGSLQTLKWGMYDESKKELTLSVFGGFKPGYGGTTGQWTEPVEAQWCFLMNLARCANFTYVFRFDEDYMRADIDIEGNI